MTIKCPKCGELAVAEDKFCSLCGAEIFLNKSGSDENLIYDRKGVIEMSVIKATDVTVEKLIEIFTNAAFEVTEDENDHELYVKGGDFPLWVSIDEDGKYIKLRTYLACKDGAPLEDLSDLSAACNQYILVNFTPTVYEDGRGYLNGYYYMYFNFGLIAPQLVYTVKQFSEIFLSAIRGSDPDDKFFS